MHSDISSSLSRHRYKEALRTAMKVAQYGNQIIQAAEHGSIYPGKATFTGAKNSLATLAFGWRICRYLAIVMQPFMPFSSQRLWHSIGEQGDVSQVSWYEAINWNTPMKWNDSKPEPLFNRLDLEEILEHEQSLVSKSDQESNNTPKAIKGGKKGGKKMNKEVEGVKYLNFDDFMKVELKVGRILNVENHPNADKLYVITLDDGSEGRTICAGLKEYYTIEDLQDKSVVFVANLKPRPLRGITSEGMMLAADDGNGNVKLITIDGDIRTGSQVR